MSITIRKISSKKELLQFIKFPIGLYNENDHYVPPIIDFELSTLQKDKNPAFDDCEAMYWVAENGQKTVGRIAAILHKTEFNEKKLVRFGWVDFIDDDQVSQSLFDIVEEWAQSKGAEGLHGPLGFTDLDFEGALVSGYDQRASQATIYNYPYYIEHYKRLGFEKAVDWIELRGSIPEVVPERLSRGAKLATDRYGLRVKRFKKAKEILRYSKNIFSILNKSYKDLYGYYALNDKQIAYYTSQYFGFVRKEFISIVVNKEDEVIAIAIALPSLSKAFRKAKGKLYPFGFIHVLKAFYFDKNLDFFLIGVDPKYKNKAVNAIIFNEMLVACMDKGIKYFMTGPMLENNRGVLNLWADLQDHLDEVNIRRRCYIKRLNSVS